MHRTIHNFLTESISWEDILHDVYVNYNDHRSFYSPSVISSLCLNTFLGMHNISPKTTKIKRHFQNLMCEISNRVSDFMNIMIIRYVHRQHGFDSSINAFGQIGTRLIVGAILYPCFIFGIEVCKLSTTILRPVIAQQNTWHAKQKENFQLFNIGNRCRLLQRKQDKKCTQIVCDQQNEQNFGSLIWAGEQQD